MSLDAFVLLFCSGKLQQCWTASNSAESKSPKFRVTEAIWYTCSLPCTESQLCEIELWSVEKNSYVLFSF